MLFPQVVLSLCIAGAIICSSDDDEFQQAAEKAISELVIDESLLRRMPEVQADVELVLNKIWPDAPVVRYGSIDSHTATQGSDIDLTVLMPDDGRPIHETKLLSRAWRALEKYPHLFGEFYKPAAKITVLQCVHLPTGIPIDLSFNRRMSIQNIAMNRYFVDLDTRVFQMAILTKRWSRLRGVKIHQLFTNYDMVLLVIFYMQQERVVPPVSLLQQNAEPYFIGKWNAAFRELEYHTNNTKSLYELLGGFFEYYSVLDYDRYVISVFAGYPVEKEAFRDLDILPAEFALYKHNVLNNISEPLDLSENFTMIECFDFNEKAGFVLNLQQFKNAAEAYRKYNGTKFLEYLLSDDEQINNITIPTT